ncbi:peptidyl-Lys metalloendopeptidase [Rhizoctonia solani AG-1 IB]|uniref:Peptidyl-Lys metalloendopeptidase n=1 Tax=Thanatephorus cucumeris (strain AG1-IB / isolate 7/3/14) TaxID=1108050 RepID=M5CBZ1_THACB|nr:peptidyl-Lys metalloendopeptidase [Rhizoctonia solani AG-1 IB]CEL61406.1 peptidyl-Lys metalloendopeptidase [Rhizoctonia solani AG-1 IB]
MRNTFAATIASLIILRVSATPGLSLTVVPVTTSDVNGLLVTAILNNTGSDTLTLLNDPRSVLSPLPTGIFTLTNGKGSPEFIGIRVKYSPDKVAKEGNPASFTVLAPGESREFVHNLSSVYNFTQTGPGKYSIVALDTFDHIDLSGNLATLKATSQPSTFEITGNFIPQASLQIRSSALKSRQSPSKFEDCSRSQRKSINKAIPIAEASITESLSWFNTHSSGTQRYTSWFGAHDLKRSGKAGRFFQSIQGKSMQSTYNCSCNVEDAYAYVYPNGPYTVYLCPAFWRAPDEGADSKAGTLIHEQTHFTVNGGAKDTAYGREGCRGLASSYPDEAVQNADNYEYFAENIPKET